jgi:hypothetical protein
MSESVEVLTALERAVTSIRSLETVTRRHYGTGSAEHDHCITICLAAEALVDWIPTARERILRQEYPGWFGGGESGG